MNLDIVARNVIMLLVALTGSDDAESVDCMLHLWYSAFIAGSHAAILSTRILPLIEEVNKKIACRAKGSTQAKTWTFGARTLRVVLTKEVWAQLPSYLKLPNDLCVDKAQKVMTAVTLAPSRIDYRDRNRLGLSNMRRVCGNRFREDGMLLPFGQSRDCFDTPNP